MLLYWADSIKTSALARQRQRLRQRQKHSNNNDTDIDNDNETTTPTVKQNNSQTPPIRLYYHSISMRVCVSVCVYMCAHIHFVVGLVISISMPQKVVTPHFILLVFRHHLSLVFVVFPSLFNALLGRQTVNTPPRSPPSRKLCI